MSKPSRIIEARRLLGFTEVIGDRYLIAATVGPGLDPVLLSMGRSPAYRAEAPGGASFAKKRAARPNRMN